MTNRRFCYLDNNATTRVAPEVFEAMAPYLRDHWGNPSSAYAFGHDLGRAIDQARASIAELLGAEPQEIVFTSCGTEGNNTAFQSALLAHPRKRHVVTTVVEHSANLKFGQLLEKRGYEVTYLPVEADGSLDLCELEAALRPDTALASVMWANNETGVLFPMEEIAAICRGKGVLFHTDAVQVPGKLEIDAHSLGIDYLSISAHKLHAPKGIGALYVGKKAPFTPYIVGGGQEKGRRGGTENVPYIVGFGKAAELALNSIREENTRIRTLRDRMEKSILAAIPGVSRNGSKEQRLPNTSNLAFSDVEAEGLLLLLDQAGICASSGSACTTGALTPSHVLTAMGLKADRARGSIRFSLGIYNSEQDVDQLLDCLPAIVAKLRGHSSKPPKVRSAAKPAAASRP